MIKNVVMILSLMCAWAAALGLGGTGIYIAYFLEIKKDTTPLGMGCFFFGIMACLLTLTFFGVFDWAWKDNQQD